MYGSSPLGLSSAVHTVLAYPKTAITIAMCCAALASFKAGSSRSDILDSPACMEATCEETASTESLPALTETPLFVLPPAPPGTACRLVPKVKPPVAHVARPHKKKVHASGEQPIRKPGVHKHHVKKHHAPAPVEYERVCD